VSIDVYLVEEHSCQISGVPVGQSKISEPTCYTISGQFSTTSG